MHWELWDTETGNLVGDYDSEDDALAVVRDAFYRLAGPITHWRSEEHDDEGGVTPPPPGYCRQDLVARSNGASEQAAAVRSVLASIPIAGQHVSIVRHASQCRG
jgi:hypothetical protein